MRRNGSGYVLGHHIKTYTNEFNNDLAPPIMIRFHTYDDRRFERLIRTAMEVLIETLKAFLESVK